MEEVIDADRLFVMDEGKIVMSGTPREVFSNVDRLKALRLDVPQVTLLAHALIGRGLDLKPDILSKEELIESLCALPEAEAAKTGLRKESAADRASPNDPYFLSLFSVVLLGGGLWQRRIRRSMSPKTT